MQSWNWPAVKKSARIIIQPSLLKPDLSFKKLSDIDWNYLYDNHGLKAICFDKDNTITAPYSQNLHFSVIPSIESCKNVFDGRIAIFSNSIGSSQYDPRFEKADLFTKTYGIDVIRHHSKKPDGAQEILAHFRDLKRHQIAVIGDRLLTDVVMANEAEFFSILLTEPLSIQGDNIFAIIFRFAENLILKLLKIK